MLHSGPEGNKYEEILKQIVVKLNALPETQKGQRQDLISQVVLECPRDELFGPFFNAMLKTTINSRAARDNFVIAMCVKKHFDYLLKNEPQLEYFTKINFSPLNFVVCNKLVEGLSINANIDQDLIRKNIKELCNNWEKYYKPAKAEEDKEIDASALAKKIEKAQEQAGIPGNPHSFHQPAKKGDLRGSIPHNPSSHCILL